MSGGVVEPVTDIGRWLEVLMETVRRKCSRVGETLLCGAATFVLALTGCGVDGGGGENDAKVSEAPAPPTRHAPLPAGEADAPTRADVLRVYGMMWAERVKAYRVASADGTALKRYMTPDALGALDADLARMGKERTQMRGALAHQPSVSALAAHARPPTATVKDCVDGSRWQTLDTTTGWRIPSPPGQPSRYVATARMERGAGERWTVAEYTVDRTRSC